MIFLVGHERVHDGLVLEQLSLENGFVSAFSFKLKVLC